MANSAKRFADLCGASDVIKTTEYDTKNLYYVILANLSVGAAKTGAIKRGTERSGHVYGLNGKVSELINGFISPKSTMFIKR